jgi:lysozyme family protein
MAQDNFSAALEETLRHEGGFVDHPLDPGGPTNLGITQATLAAFRGKPVSRAQLMALRKDEAAQIYRNGYWDAVKGDSLPAGIDLAVFDLAVNSGPGRSIRLLQQALGVPMDGVLGPRTLAALAEAAPLTVIDALTDLRLSFLRQLATWPVFGRGWEKRVRSVQQAARRSVPISPQNLPETRQHPADMPPQSILPPEKDTRMLNDTKSILLSRTVWANLIGLSAFGLGLIGIDTGLVDQNALVNAVLALITAGSFIASTFFRITSVHRLR